MTRAEKEARLAEVKADIALARQALRDILAGKKQSYGVGTRNASAYSMSIPELRAWISELTKEQADLEADLAGKARRVGYRFRPGY